MEPKLKSSPEELMQKFYSLKSFEDLANLLEIKSSYLNHLLYKVPLIDRYKTFEIKKKSGGKRIIANPIKPIKVIQQKLLQILELVYEPRCSAFGFIKHRDILKNANRHSVYKNTKKHKKKTKLKFVLNIDIKDFFPSIHFGRVRGIFTSVPYRLPLKVATWLAQICCYEYGLPQGAPTSPIISNMICNRLDSQLQNLAKRKRCTYTRYADDITFSTNISRFPSSLAAKEADGNVALGKELEDILKNNGFMINTAKLRLQSTMQRQEITGLTVNRFPNVRRTFIREIRAILHDWESTSYEDAQKKHLSKRTKNRYPDKKDLSLKEILAGKIEFLRMIRGDNDPIYRRYGLQLERLDDSYIFRGTRADASTSKTTEGEIVLSVPTAKIFISYARQDEIEVKNLYHRLKDAGFQPWMDQEDIVGGEKWEIAINTSIDTSDVFVFCITKSSRNKRGVIQQEIRKALEKAEQRLDTDITIIPLLLEEVEIPASLGNYQAIKYFEPNGWNRLTQAIQTAIKRLEDNS